ncbi:hypothetical protein C5167_041250 [Papaver somniferum]|uniref:PGG domain-containing protein n=1 Tax=Papaver somniferum TaxID=3469 RepID=A0A4Y7IHC8_PAPSO|nr:hypothetical protein C5167_041250 [Papaver somniferum]
MGIIRRFFNATVGAVSKYSNKVRISAEEQLELGTTSSSFPYCHQTAEYIRELDLNRPLLLAAMNGNWESARDFLEKNPCSVNARITGSGRTALHVAAGSGHSKFVLELVKLMSVEALELKDSYDGNTALHLAVIAGLEDAVKAMVQKHKELTRICNENKLNPLLNAAIYVNKEHQEIITFLCDEMKDEPSNFQGHLGAQLICSITRAGLYELAFKLIGRHASLATAQGNDGNTALCVLAEKDISIPTAYEESILSFLTYHRLSTITDEMPSIFLRVLLWFDHKSRGFHHGKRKSKNVLKLAKLIVEKFSDMPGEDVYHFFNRSDFLNSATKNGSIDIVNICISKYPDQLWIPQEQRNIFQIAVENRQEKMFDYLYDHMNADEKILTTRPVDSNGGNMLHVAAKIAPPSRLNIYSSPVAQMQSEIIWFKKVNKRVPRAFRSMRNNDRETPQEVFTREHKDLVKKAEAYMIRTAESCLVVAALVATVAFAAAITLPGGTFSDGTDATEKGKPVHLQKQSFLAFMVADAVALFSSTTAILLFLSIYIVNHNEGNFKEVLPRTLKRGVGSLILSVLSVVIAFSMAISIILKDRYIWVPYLMFAVAAFTFYISLNRPLKLIFELDEIEKPLYWTTSRDHQPDVPLP